MDDSIGLYIHIPFCKAKCYYCDFNSYSGREHLAGSYFHAMKNEIIARSASIEDRSVSSIFIGGGTPSLVDPAYIRDLLEVCSKLFCIEADAEISIESNPGTLDYDKLRQYRDMGINRLSIGLQAWQDSLLKSIGRIHDRQQFIDNLNAAVRAGFDNINVDLIFGLPGQTFEEWAETLEAVTSAGHLNHISCYSLKIEEGTVMGDRLEAGTLVPVDDALDRRMYHYAIEFLAKKGFRHYEISNFAYPGYESRHNLVYWKVKEYAGFGAGAHSFLDSARFSNVSGIEQYIRAAENMAAGAETGKDLESGLFEDTQQIDNNEAMAEFMILGLRLTEGVSSAEFENRFGENLYDIYGDKLKKLVGKGLVSVEKNCACEGGTAYTYKLTKLGLDLANSVFVEFI